MEYQRLKITNKEFIQISTLIYELFGIYMPDSKKNLVKNRLNNYLIKHGFKSFNDYYKTIMAKNTEKTHLLNLIDKVSTNYTYFFRETDHFNFLIKTILPEIEKKFVDGINTITIWSAGCSSGEEAYTIAMILDNFFQSQRNRLDIRILATDISVSALQKAGKGIYNKEALKKMPVIYKHKYFSAIDDENYILKKKITNLVTFRRLNLMREIFPFKNKFDAIFCRNVMIYFNHESRMKLATNFHKFIVENGYLFIGHSETLPKDLSLYKFIAPSIYKKS